MAHILEDVIQRINPGIEYKTIFQNCVNAYKKHSMMANGKIIFRAD